MKPLFLRYPARPDPGPGLGPPACSPSSQPAVHPLGQPHMNSMGPPLSSTCDLKSSSDPGFPTPDRTTNPAHGYSATQGQRPIQSSCKRSRLALRRVNSCTSEITSPGSVIKRPNGYSISLTGILANTPP